MASSRRSDYGEEFVERLRKDRFKKAYIFVNGISSEEDEELDFDEGDEVASYAIATIPQHPPPRPSSTHSSRRSVGPSFIQRASGAYGFDARDLYFFGMLTELTDKFTPEHIARMIAQNPPPHEYRTLVSTQRVAYLLYYSLYGRYLNVEKFHHVFNREFYKYTSLGDTERNAFLKICQHTLEEYRRRLLEQNKQAYKMTQKHLFSDERATPDSRASDRPSVCADGSEDLNSVDSMAKELMFYRSPHLPLHFSTGGRIIFVDPDVSMSVVCIEDTKKFYRDIEGKRYVEMVESFKGPLIVGHTPSQTPLLFIQRQIDRILTSDLYQANPLSGDANDCLLIWHLLEMLICQQGKVTGPDLARLLCLKQNYWSCSKQSFSRSNSNFNRDRSYTLRQNSCESTTPELETQTMDKVTQFLLGGHLEEAIEAAISGGLLFDALLLAHRLFRNDQRRLEEIEARLMSYRSPQHPITTLISVAADLPVPLLNNPTMDDANGWRQHIAIVLANLQTQTAINAVYQLGLTLAQKEFNSAADFCFLAVNLLTGYNCFEPPINSDETSEQTMHRRHIQLISASLPDDEMNTCITRFGWSILDYQATEIYDYALQLRNNMAKTTMAMSNDYVIARRQYSQLLTELGGFSYSIELYNTTAHNEIGLTKKEQQPQPMVLAQQPQPMALPQQPQPMVLPQQPQPMIPPQQPQPMIPPQQHQAEEKKNIHNRRETEEYQQQNISFISEHALDNVYGEISPKDANVENAHFAFYADQDHGETSKSEVSFSSNQQQPMEEFQIGNQRRETLLPFQEPKAKNSFVFEHKSDPNETKLMENNMEENTNVGWYNNQVHGEQTKNELLSSSKFFRQESLEGVQKTHRRESLPPFQENQQSKLKNSQVSDQSSGSGGFLGGITRGLLSKIKPQAHNEMRLPDDKDPKITWDAQLGRYVDQEQKETPQEKLPPPPTFFSQKTIAEQKKHVQEPSQDEQQPVDFPVPLIPISAPSLPSSNTTPTPPSRPFQGRARYANAWNS